MIKSVDAAGRVFYTIDTNQLQASTTSATHPLLTDGTNNTTNSNTTVVNNDNTVLHTELISTNTTNTHNTTSNSNIIIELKHVNFYYTSRVSKRVLTNVNLTIPKYSFTCLIGQSGVGKSTLFNILCGLQKLEEPSSGDIYLNDEHIEKLDPLWLYKNVSVFVCMYMYKCIQLYIC